MEVKTISSYNTIVTINEIKRYIDYNDSNTEDISMLLSMAKSAQELCEQYTDQFFSERIVVFYFEKSIDFDDINKTVKFMYSPINSVSELVSIGTDNAETELTENTNYYLRGIKSRELYIPEIFTTGASSEIHAFKATVNAGYAHAPSVVKDCVLKLVYEWYNVKGNYIPILNDQVKNILSSYGNNGWL